MSLIELIAGVEAREPTLTVFNADPAVTEELREYFADRSLRIVEERTDSGPDGYAVLSRDGEFVTAVTVDELLPGVGDETDVSDETGASDDGPSDAGAADGHGARSGDASGETRRGDRRLVGEPILDHLDETMFTSYSHADMVAASREIEDRAWRVGDGELHAGFQTLDVLTGETDTYDLLGEKDRLSVHAYAANEGDPPDVEHYTVHVGETAEIRETWFVAYDGGGFDDAKCALLAEERAPGEFFGFWSYDPETVDYIIDYLTEQYGTGDGEIEPTDGA